MISTEPGASESRAWAMTWQHARYTFKGQRMSTSFLKMPAKYSPYTATQQHDPPPDHCTPSASGYNGLYNIGNAVIQPFHQDAPTHQEDEDDQPPPCQITFDSKLAKLRVVADLDPRIECRLKRVWNPHLKFLRWKDVRFTTKYPLGGNIGNSQWKSRVEGRYVCFETAHPHPHAL